MRTNISWLLRCVVVCSILLIIQIFSVYHPTRKVEFESSLKKEEHGQTQNEPNQTEAWPNSGQFDLSKLIGNLSDSSGCGFEYNILVAIISCPTHFLLREAIRKTFGSVLPIRFFLGRCKDTVLQPLQNEARKHGDLVIYDFLDTYGNLTLKTFSVLDFVKKCAPSVKLLIKIDDDTFVNPVRLRQVLDENRVFPSTDATERRKPLIFGNIQNGSKPFRNRTSKYYVSKKEYTPSTYPPFVSGPLYFMNRLSVEALHQSALRSSSRSKKRSLYLEDVFFTGNLNENAIEWYPEFSSFHWISEIASKVSESFNKTTPSISPFLYSRFDGEGRECFPSECRRVGPWRPQ